MSFLAALAWKLADSRNLRKKSYTNCGGDDDNDENDVNKYTNDDGVDKYDFGENDDDEDLGSLR